VKIKILYEDKDVLVVDKPAGLSVEDIKEIYPGFFLAHRLDKETSGVLVLAKNEETLDSLKNQFQKRKVKKTYIAIVNGYVKKDFGIIDKSIGRTRSDPRKRHAGRGVVGKEREAVTEYKVLKRFVIPCVQNFFRSSQQVGSHTDKNFEHTAPFTYLEVYPKTGRTHQIRVHLKYLNYPVVGDKLYNPKGAMPAGLSRMALHAKSIEFKTPTNKTIKVESPAPKALELDVL
jgi:23S rRNA pseudouridine1911/1915/1917 synthase